MRSNPEAAANALDSKDPGDETRARILTAAIAQFKSKGMAGARVDEIAREAGCNKQLIYYYFGDKAGLYEQALMTMVGRNTGKLKLRVGQELPTNPVLEWLRASAEPDDELSDWRGLWLWEAVESSPAAEVPLHEERREVWRRQVADVKRAQDAGLIRDDLDADILTLALISIATFPSIFPRLAELTSGRLPDDPRFLRRQDKFFRQLSQLFAPDDD